MTVHGADVERRRFYRPNCVEKRGNVTTVTFGSVVRTISYQCRECGQGWLVQAPERCARARSALTGPHASRLFSATHGRELPF
jgi:hypothetical protein